MKNPTSNHNLGRRESAPLHERERVMSEMIVIEWGMNFTGVCKCGRESIAQVWNHTKGDFIEKCPKCLRKAEKAARRKN